MVMAPSLSTSITGMKTAQGQLEIIGRNIANVDTVGYTRKYAEQNNVVRAGYNMGVDLGHTLRRVDESLLKSFLASNSSTFNLGAQADFLNKADILLGTPEGNNSIAANVSNLQTAFETFAAAVNSSPARYSLMTSADSLATRLNSLTKEIQKLRGDADIAIAGAVDKTNQYLDEIAALNDSIVKYTVLNYDGLADLEDKRDTALRDLSGMLDITYFKRENGEIVIQTKEGITLLDRKPHYLSHDAVSQAGPTVTYASGSIAGIFVDGKDITGSIRDGEIKGLIEIRDNTLVSLQAQLDELAGVLRDTVNQIHNRGTAYPQTPSLLEGSRTFIDSSIQQISIDKGDVRFTIFDSAGKQVKTTTLVGGLGFSSGTVDTMAAALNAWLTSPAGANLPQAEASIVDGKFVINTGDSNYTFSVVDEASSTPGSPQQDASLSFDVDGDGIYDRKFEGFSSFFGLNNFFTPAAAESLYDSKVMDRSANLGVTAPIILQFSDTAHPMSYATLSVFPNDSLQDIVNRINNDPTLSQNLVASLVPNGNGVVLRIMNTEGEQLEISETGSNTGFLDRIGLKPSHTGASEQISVRREIKLSPGLIAGGSPEFNHSAGEYEQNASFNNIANQMAKAFTTAQQFVQTGNLATMSTTMADYASTFVGIIASQTLNAEADLAYQAELSNSIATKEAQISGVDMDEELAQLILFQQSYAACAKSFTAATEMLDTLINMV